MKFMCLGDLHLTDRTPENRTDDFPQTQLEKIKWILELAKRTYCDCILQPGDFFDYSTVSNELMRTYISLFRQFGMPIFTILGQHDQRYHNQSIKNTPLGVLDAAGAVSIVRSPMDIGGKVTVFGSGWGWSVPEPALKKVFNVLICHKMIIDDEKVWAGQTGHEVARPFLLKTGYSLIVSGDNHQRFQVSSQGGDKHLVNCGSLMRSRVDQIHHCPAVYTVNSDTRKIEEFIIPVKDIRTVMNLPEDAMEKEKIEEFIKWAMEEKERLGIFIEQLSENEKALDYKKRVMEYVAENKVENKVKRIIENIFSEL